MLNKKRLIEYRILFLVRKHDGKREHKFPTCSKNYM